MGSNRKSNHAPNRCMDSMVNCMDHVLMRGIGETEKSHFEVCLRFECTWEMARARESSCNHTCAIQLSAMTGSSNDCGGAPNFCELFRSLPVFVDGDYKY
jgi:hypothetical protein